MTPRIVTPVRVLMTSIAVRQAIVTATVVMAALFVFGFVALATVERSARADVLRTIDTDIAGLVDIAAQGGTAELSKRIDERTELESSVGAHAYYFVGSTAGGKVAGNLNAAPAIDPTRSETVAITIGGEPVLMRATKVHGGLTLVVGRSLAPGRGVVSELRRSFLIAAIAIVAGALLVGLLAAYRLASGIVSLNRTFARFENGDLAARTEPQTRGELDILGGKIDRHLDRIEQLLQAQRAISDNIAHELRTPLVHLDNRLLEAIAASRDDGITRQLEAARGDIRSVVSLFDALLDIAFTEAATRQQSEKDRFDLSELIGGVAELYAASAEDAGLEFSARIAPGIMMSGEAMQMSRLVANLLDNAIKFCPAGCRVRLSVEPGPRIVVQDDGPGIASAEVDLVFGRFWRGPAGISGGGGHGLGLSLVKVIAVRHGLTAYVEDAQPGARFVIERSNNR